MGVPVSRRDLFRGRVVGHDGALRPPWAAADADFLSRCDRCGECVRACAEGVLVKGAGGFPEVSFRHGHCIFCGDCLSVCRPGALRREAVDAAPWTLAATVSADCLCDSGIACRVCGDFCDAGAIRFRPQVGGRLRLELDGGACTGCGACVAPCPVRAVAVTRRQDMDEVMACA